MCVYVCVCVCVCVCVLPVSDLLQKHRKYGGSEGRTNNKMATNRETVASVTNLQTHKQNLHFFQAIRINVDLHKLTLYLIYRFIKPALLSQTSCESVLILTSTWCNTAARLMNKDFTTKYLPEPSDQKSSQAFCVFYFNLLGLSIERKQDFVSVQRVLY